MSNTETVSEQDIGRFQNLRLALPFGFFRSIVRDGFHNLSHHSSVRANMDRFAELNTYHHGTLVYFLDKLKAD
jgi:hypothetical protein